MLSRRGWLEFPTFATRDPLEWVKWIFQGGGGRGRREIDLTAGIILLSDPINWKAAMEAPNFYVWNDQRDQICTA